MEKRHLALAAFGLLLSVGHVAAGDRPVLKDEKDRINYSVGYQVGGDFKEQGVALNPEAFVRGGRDALQGAEPLMTLEEMRKTLLELKKKVDAFDMARKRGAAERYRGEGREFLAANAKKEGVVTLPSGLQYRVVREGKGKSPTLNDSVTVSYRGTLINDSEFDSTYRNGKPATFTLTNTMPGWREALPKMKEGAKWQLFIPADLAFGERGPLADRTVIYEIELLEVKKGSEGGN